MMMPGFNPMQLIMNKIMNDPRIQQNPQAREILQVIQSGDSARGEELARNYCQTYGVTPEQGLQQAKNFFHLK